ncbi:hypothetical protein PHO31112_04752 [Pandoraea horticolens]|uniref:Type VI secretion system component TssM1 N-terminal domain-containing protein n=1 Tax=Pandoraea horticolens TaxID=2508298 RepID=A0A5E4YT44_9BURK|nr:type VI secretion protein IcmF/TssM N-terminal domain-containing protein [Pandoraea horticolens]VVE51971.1 hypothetical protein PHO31112_04752 [Pandoraea horticolens]
MLKIFAKGALWVVLLLILLLACWLTALFLGWSAWSGLLLLCGVLVGAWCVGRAWRMWKTWRPRRKLTQEGAAAAPARDTARVDIAWKHGVRLLRNLRNSRFPRWDSTLYALPWIMVMGTAGSGKSTLLTRSRLSSTLRPVNQRDPVPPTNSLDWWYLDHSVIVEPAGDIVDAADPAHEQADWRHLLHRLSRTRRREPLNGIVLTLPAGLLLQADAQQLTDAGRAMRSRIDAMSRIYEAHIPIWIVLTQCDKIPGFVAWGRELPAAMLDTPLGVEAQAANATDFVAQAFAAIDRRLGEVRIEQSRSFGSDSSALFFPEHAAAMAVPLRAYLAPAFDENPYGETPWLKGIYFTAQVMPDAPDPIQRSEESGASGIRETRMPPETPPVGAAQGPERTEGVRKDTSVPQGWFSKDLFSVVLPAQRDAYRPYTRNGLWRRFARHGMVVGWLTLCGLSAVLLTWGYLDARQVITTLSARPQTPNFNGDLASRLRELSELDMTNRMLEAHESLGLYRWLPYHWQLNRLANHFQRGFSDDFRRYALAQGVDQMMAPQLAALSTSTDDMMVAAYVQHYVRRINALEAALTQQPQGDAPLPGSELQALSLRLDPHAPYDPMMASRFAMLYGDYVRWQPDRGALQAERDSLRNNLAQLDIANRSTSWLMAWADLQGNVTPITLASFWGIPDRPELPRVPRAYTLDGRRAVSGFIDELARAAGDDPLLKAPRVTLARRYREQQRDAWLRFATDFADSRRYLTGEQQWRDAFALILTPGDPYLRVIHQIAATFSNSLDGGRAAPDWAQLAVRLDSLITSSKNSGGSFEQRSAALLSLANAVGTDAVRAVGTRGADSIAQRVRGSTALAQALGVYHEQLAAAIQVMRQGDGHALKLTADTYAYGTDAAIPNTPLHTAAETIDAMKKSDGIAAHPADLSIWNLLRGPLDFVLDYGGRVSACALQKDWEAQVLAPLQGVSSPQLMDAALYGDAGVVPAFMAGAVKPFVVRDATQYRPRQVQGQSISLNGAFYAFVSQAQRAHVGVQQAQQTAEAQAAELPALEQQINEISTKLDTLKATVGIVKLTAQPAEVNPGAKVLPEQSSLTLQCTSGQTTLDNYNFPSSKTFNWSLATCGDVTLDMRLPGVKLTRHWSGPRAFVDFLRASADGRYTFDLRDYPNEQKMLPASVEWVKLRYQQQGQGPLLASFDEADRLTKLLKMLTDRRAALQSASAAAASSVSEKAPRSNVYAVPREISACWVNAVPVQEGKVAPATTSRMSRNTASVAN